MPSAGTVRCTLYPGQPDRDQLNVKATVCPSCACTHGLGDLQCPKIEKAARRTRTPERTSTAPGGRPEPPEPDTPRRGPRTPPPRRPGPNKQPPPTDHTRHGQNKTNQGRTTTQRQTAQTNRTNRQRRTKTDGQTRRQTDRRTDRQTDTRTDRRPDARQQTGRKQPKAATLSQQRSGSSPHCLIAAHDCTAARQTG